MFMRSFLAASLACAIAAHALGQAGPVITSLSTNEWPASPPTTTLTINGTGFSPSGNVVKIGNVDVTETTISTTQINVTSPALTNKWGALDVSVTTSGGAATTTAVGALFWKTLTVSGTFTIGANTAEFASSPGVIDVVVPASATLTMSGTNYVNSLTMNGSPGGKLNHPQGEAGFEVIAAGDVNLTGSSLIDLNGRGFAGQAGPGTAPAGFGAQPGGSHGGRGGWGTNTALAIPEPEAIYGSVTAPVTLGSAGSGDNGDQFRGGKGGGAIKMVAQNIFIDASAAVRANGGTATAGSSGGGAGGSIWLTAVQNAQIVGVVEANGGTRSVSGGNGGGGRIAVYGQTGSIPSTIRAGVADTNAGLLQGAAGTAYIAFGAAPPQLIARAFDGISGSPNNNPLQATELPAGTVLSVGTVWADNGATLRTASACLTCSVIAATNYSTIESAGTHVLNTLTLSNNSVLTHAPADPGGIDITVNGNFTLPSGSRIDVTGKGYPSGVGPGLPIPHIDGAGGTYGGEGAVGNSSTNVRAGPAYGSLVHPADLGTGGAGVGPTRTGGGKAGGRVRLHVTGDVVINGTSMGISADGDDSGSSTAGYGSGGSIDLIVGGAISGAGVISANGGGSSVNGGGGGRVAIHAGTDVGLLGTVRAYGASNLYAGAGTIYRKIGTSAGHLSVRNSDGGVNFLHERMTDLTSFAPGLFRTLVVSGESNVVLRRALNQSDVYDLDELLVSSGASVSHDAPAQGDPSAGALTIVVQNDVNLNSGRIDVSGKGWQSNLGPGSVPVAAVATGGGPGGSHGGAGGSGSGGAAAGAIYGSSTLPNTIGSGGSGAQGFSHLGGSGGGAVELRVNGVLTLTNGSAILAHGNGGVAAGPTLPGSVTPHHSGGGGSGGSIMIVCDRLVRTGGTISADGGNAAQYGGGGGGGRVAIYSGQCVQGGTGNYTAGFGNGFNGGNGAVGTVFAPAECSVILSPTAGPAAISTALNQNTTGNLTIRLTPNSPAGSSYMGATVAYGNAARIIRIVSEDYYDTPQDPWVQPPTVVADPAGTTITVTGTNPAAALFLEGLTIGTSVSAGPAIDVTDFAGIVVVDRCWVLTSTTPPASGDRPAIRVNNNLPGVPSRCAVQRSTVTGYPGLKVGGTSQATVIGGTLNSYDVAANAAVNFDLPGAAPANFGPALPSGSLTVGTPFLEVETPALFVPGQPFVTVLNGVPNSLVYLYLAGSPDFDFVPTISGALLVSFAGGLSPPVGGMVMLDPKGYWAFDPSPPISPSIFVGSTFYLQGVSDVPGSPGTFKFSNVKLIQGGF